MYELSKGTRISDPMVCMVRNIHVFRKSPLADMQLAIYFQCTIIRLCDRNHNAKKQ